MSQLTIYDETDGRELARHDEHADISRELAAVGVEFERWQAEQPLAEDADSEAVQQAYTREIEKLNARYGFKSIDVIAIRPDNPEREAIRDKFLHEHTHDDFEVRFFVGGQGLFNLRLNGRVYAVLCTRGDLISVPANTRHWFDTGEYPDLKAIRFFTTDEGWVGRFTGDDIADRFPRMAAA